ncbi:MopE-related protein [Hyalangium sp.]|uniref:MopE-related protein n=1 Tax=Hyalangium sp. TaxID=2028555 RepID=UPI002D223130|nr:MopE-related protein [Hyalangium sp.]HYH99439.1 MopE-related protein [Hyalangium sp.]
MIIADSSGAMSTAIASNNSCDYPNDRLGHMRCALTKTLPPYDGRVSMGLASFARRMTNCPAGACNPGMSGCTFQSLTGDAAGLTCSSGCGPEPAPAAPSSSSRAGANILVPMLRDTTPTPPSNMSELLSWLDNQCTGAKELFADGCSPLNGALRDMYRSLSNQWTYPGPGATVTFVSPLTSVANGERPCRSVNVILIANGTDNCDMSADAPNAAAALLTGFTKDGISWSIRTFVIEIGNLDAMADQIAAAGGTGSAYHANNEAEISAALKSIIDSSIKTESCNGADDDCNSCVDEGFNIGQVCTVGVGPCESSGTVQCAGLTSSACSAVAGMPSAETCDGVDNNCDDAVDEGFNVGQACTVGVGACQASGTIGCTAMGGASCNGAPGSPEQETCDGVDNDCDGVVDNGFALGGACTAGVGACKVSGTLQCDGMGSTACSAVAGAPGPEVCGDEADNDCDGETDEGCQGDPNDDDDQDGNNPPESGSCGCTLPSPMEPEGMIACLLGLAAALVARRRRRPR